MASFATIPIEARTSVYEYVFSGIVLSPRPVARRTRNGTKAAVGLYPAPLNLYLVNKQVFLETSRILLRFVTIRLKSRDQLQVLARQPLIANLIIGEELSTETDMLTNNAAATTVGALSHLKSIRFELDRCCEVGQSLKAASDRPLASPRRNHFGWQTQHPSLIYYYSLWHSSPLRTLGWRGGKIMDNLTSMVASGTNVIFVFKEVEFVWRSKNGSMVRFWP